MKYFSKLGFILADMYILAIAVLILTAPSPECVPVAGHSFCPAVITPGSLILSILLLPGLLIVYAPSGNIIPQVPILSILINVLIVYLTGYVVELLFKKYKNRKIDINLIK